MREVRLGEIMPCSPAVGNRGSRCKACLRRLAAVGEGRLGNGSRDFQSPGFSRPQGND